MSRSVHSPVPLQRGERTHEKNSTASSHPKGCPYRLLARNRKAINVNGTAIMTAITVCSCGAFVSCMIVSMETMTGSPHQAARRKISRKKGCDQRKDAGASTWDKLFLMSAAGRILVSLPGLLG